MQVGCKPRMLDVDLIGAHGKVGRPEEALVISTNRPSLVCFDLPQTDYSAGNSPSGSVTDRSLQCPARLQCLSPGGGHAHQRKQQRKAGPTQPAIIRQWFVAPEPKIQGTPPLLETNSIGPYSAPHSKQVEGK